MDDAQLIRTCSVLSSAAALALVQAACRHAKEQGWVVAAIATDPAGEPLAMLRMDGAPAAVMGYAADKAYTSASMRRTTRAVYARMSGSDALRAGLASRKRLLVWEGGIPILAKGVVIGAIGVSGAEGHEDAECARVALCSLGLEAPDDGAGQAQADSAPRR